VATQRTRNIHEPAPAVAKALLRGEPAPPSDFKFHGERVPHRDREAQIAEAAYLRAERRGFTPGLELQDWLEAEREIDAVQSARESDRR
jgi:hypothetical protein